MFFADHIFNIELKYSFYCKTNQYIYKTCDLKNGTEK